MEISDDLHPGCPQTASNESLSIFYMLGLPVFVPDFYFPISVSVGCIVAGVLFVLIWIYARKCAKILKKKLTFRRQYGRPADLSSLMTDTQLEEEHILKHNTRIRVKFACERITSFTQPLGCILNTILVIMSTLSWAIYVTIISRFPMNVRYGSCNNETAFILLCIDMVLQVFFFLHFICRFIAATDKFRFWLRFSSIMDCCTIPNTIISLATGRHYLGLSFVRAFHFRQYSTLLASWGLLKQQLHIEIAELVFNFFGIWLTGAGGIHLLENLGDFWVDGTSAQAWTYWQSVYFLLVTMSTVGFGDMYSTTVLGRIFVCIYILTALGYFASSVPEFMRKMQESDPSLTAVYKAHLGQRPLLVCGRFNAQSMNTFLTGFFHTDIDFRHRLFKMVLLRSEAYDSSLRAVLRKYHGWIQICRGSPNCPNDLERVSISAAKEAIVLSLATDDMEDDMDSENLMNAISLKLISENLRVLVQLQFYRNKFLLNNFALWNNMGRDQVICMEELKLGLIALNLQVPGFSTLIANLLLNCGDQPSVRGWRNEYYHGMSMELYDVGFSSDFDSLNFSQVALLAYEYWGVCLIAVKSQDTDDSSVHICPGLNFTIESQTMRAIVIASDEKMAKKMEHYCAPCNKQGKRKCKCDRNNREFENTLLHLTVSKPTKRKIQDIDLAEKLDHPELSTSLKGDWTPMYDITESFHWIPSVKIVDISFTVEVAHKRHFRNHIVICLLTGKGDNLMGLCNLIMPLRSKDIPRERLKDVVILANKDFINEDEWGMLRNFPNIFIVDGQPLNGSHLRSVNVTDAFSAVVLGAPKRVTTDPALLDKNILLCSVNMRSLLKDSQHVHLLTDLRHPVNAHHFSSPEEYKTDITLGIIFTEPYAQGHLFNDSILYSCISSIFYNPEVLSFMRTIISGVTASRVEHLFSEGQGIPPQLPDQQKPVCGSSESLLSMSEAPLHNLFTNPNDQNATITYEYLYMKCIETFHVVCLGLYRLNGRGSRFVFTNPPKHTKVTHLDKVYCFAPPSILAYNEVTTM